MHQGAEETSMKSFDYSRTALGRRWQEGGRARSGRAL